MNHYYCATCDAIASAPRCPRCGSHRVHVAGDLHLLALGLDAYVSLVTQGYDAPYLLVKKPSGQTRVPLDTEDLIRIEGAMSPQSLAVPPDSSE